MYLMDINLYNGVSPTFRQAVIWFHTDLFFALILYENCVAIYRQTYNISRTLVGNRIVGAGPTTFPFST